MPTIKQRIGKLLIPKLPLSRENFDILRFELNSAKVNFNNKFNPFAVSKVKKFINQDNLSINIASGPFGEKDWVNIDMFQHKNIAFTYDCRTQLPFKTNSVSRIRAEHIFEHLDRKDEAPKFLKECARVLKTNAVLRIIVPDIAKFVEAYYLKDENKWNEMGFNLENWYSPVHILNHVFRQSGEHKFGYDFESLKPFVEEFGFKAYLSTFGNSIDEKLNNDQAIHKGYSLYVDCVKK